MTFPRVTVLLSDDLNRRVLRTRTREGAQVSETQVEIAFPAPGPTRGRIALIVYDGAVEFIAGIVGESGGGAERRLFDLERLTRVQPSLPLEQIAAVLRANQRVPLQHGGTFSDRAGRSVLEMLRSYNSAVGFLLDDLLASRQDGMSRDRVRTLSVELDATATAIAFTGAPDLEPDHVLTDAEAESLLNRETLLPHQLGPSLPPQRPGSRRPLEDLVIIHDSNTFLGWRPTESDTLALRSYTNGIDRQLDLLYVNRTPVETNLGPDLVFYHVQRDSFVLLQYKAMDETSPGSGLWQCKVNKHFRDQLEVMRKLDAACKKVDKSKEFRFLASPSFVKLCRVENFDLDSLSMSSGLCLAREQVDNHISESSLEKPVLSYETVHDHMTTTLFTLLVAYGYIGTRGEGSILVEDAINASLDRNGSVIIGRYADASGKRPGRKFSRKQRQRLNGRTGERELQQRLV